ncbi:type II toxin-antitoxin system HicB family antitoxin [Photorhabdus aegyptia]
MFRFSDLPGCYFTGDTLEEAWQDAKSAIEIHFAK